MAEALVGDADLAGHTPAAVGAYQIVRADPIRLARAVVADDGADAVTVLAELEQLVVEADPVRREPLRSRLQDRLEADLREVELAPGTGRPPELVLSAGSPGLQLGDSAAGVRMVPREAGVVGGGGHLACRRAALRDLLGDSAVLEDLHRPLVEDVRLGEIRGTRSRADQKVLLALPGEQHRSGEAGATAADDQD